MKWLIEYSLADSFLIDWENRESHFDDERFLRLLKLTYKNSNDGSVETDTRLNGGKRASLEWIGSLMNDINFDEARDLENGHYVGFPTNGDCGNYLTTKGVIVVNAATKNKEAVRGYLEAFCSDFQLCIYGAGAFGYNSKRGNRDDVTVFPDNTTSIDRANAFLRKCVAAPPTYPALKEIISEELTIMYDQNRDPKDVVKIINNRVQLYLDEGN